MASIIQEARDNYDPGDPDSAYIDEGMFLTWLIDVLLAAGADEPPGYIVEEGGPGQSSAITLLYAEDPNSIIRSVEKALSEGL